VKSAELKKELFTEKAKIVLSKASAAISKDKAPCKKLVKSLKINQLLDLANLK